ncbi:uncharacterized protein LOC118274121 [Spodoptera frugiperda]|uniref:Uncharacterized protein LOC118274121 n=1 Tax=Spodoptera frugiperda TaxID=7108 RepID=A0A9R0ENX6_SPOFR|nr:uncharacterized protein LOC118274121 [Spodoptera frugiperda]
MFLTTLIIVSFLASYVVSDSCVTYNFEENFDILLSCSNLHPWILGEYSNLNLNSPNERSTKFITPLPNPSCWSSFPFIMSQNGRIEIKIYMDSENGGANLNIIIFNDSDGSAAGFGSANSGIKGWQTINVQLMISTNIKGYISIMGMASAGSTLLVDSFRYIPPGMDESLCQIYPDPPITPQ